MICETCQTGVYLTLLGGTDQQHTDDAWDERYRCEQCGQTGHYHVLEVGPHATTWFTGCLGSEHDAT